MKHFFLSLILSTAVLLNVQSSYGCSFESTEHADLLTAVRSLDAQLKKIPGECLPGGGAEAFKSVTELQNSSTQLQQMWGGTNALAPADAGAFGASAHTAMTSISNIGNSLKAASTCAKLDKKDGLITVLSSLSDVSMSLAPVLMAATVFLPAIAAGGGVAAGVLGIASKLPVGKLLSAALLMGVFSNIAEVSVELFKNDTLKMSDPSHRALVLKSICEYRRIKTNVDYLSYINTGRANVTREKKEIDIRVQTLRKRFEKDQPKMVALIDQFYAIRKQVDDETRKISATRAKLAKIGEDLSLTDDKPFRCDIVSSRVSGGTSLFTHLALPTMANVADKFSDPSYAVQRLANAIKKNEADIVKAQKEEKWIDCSTSIDSWKKNVDVLLRELTRFNREKAEQQLGALQSNSQFIAWRQENKTLEADAALLERIIGFMSASPDPRQIIPETDLIIEVQELGKRIFTHMGNNFVTGKSIAGAWLDHRISKYNEIEKEFTRIFNKLNGSLNVLYMQAYIKSKSSDIKKQPSLPLRYELEAINSKYNLENLTAKTVALINDESVKTDICKDLNAMNIHANNAGKILNSANYFCRYLEENDLKNTDIDSFIVSRCWGRISLGNNNKNYSTLDKISKSSLGNIGIRTRALTIQKQLDELKCAQPSRPKE